MARNSKGTTNGWSPNPKRKRPGVHSKCKTSRIKKSKNYKKQYKGQGRP